MLNEPLENLLRLAFEKTASDIHLSVFSKPIFRINGDLQPFGDEVLLPEQTSEFARTLLSDQQFEKFEAAGEFDFSISIRGISRFRINVYRQRGTVNMAIRVIPTRIPTLEELRLPPVASRLVNRVQGLVLVTGPTGSGKSTTLASMIDDMNQKKYRHIITLEDPIEYLHKHNKCIINQREIGTDTESFAVSLRAALRQDPDVILVGEMRDAYTMETAITAAETGHLVLSTLHTADASQAINRIIDSFPSSQQSQIRTQLSSVLTAVISQKLLPTKDKQGRIVATEVLLNTPAIANLIRDEKVYQIKNVMQTSAVLGMHTFESSLRELTDRQWIDRSVAERYLEDR